MTDLEIINRMLDIEEQQKAMWGYVKMIERTELAILVTMLGFVVMLWMIAAFR